MSSAVLGMIEVPVKLRIKLETLNTSSQPLDTSRDRISKCISKPIDFYPQVDRIDYIRISYHFFLTTCGSTGFLNGLIRKNLYKLGSNVSATSQTQVTVTLHKANTKE